MEIVKTENLGRIYQAGRVEVIALRMINLTVEAGDFFAIVGPSGSGKTTLLNLLGALDSPTHGNIYFEGEDLTRASLSRLAELRLRKIGFIFQAFNLIPVLTAWENVEYVMMLQGVPEQKRKKKAMEALIEVGLKECINRRPLDLSSGQQQRVAVARAIVTEPSMVLADEPTANLDSKTGSSLMDLLADLNQRRGITFVFSTHDPLIMQRAKRVAYLKDGKIEK